MAHYRLPLKEWIDILWRFCQYIRIEELQMK